MPISGDYIRSLDGDRECLEALAYLADVAPRYPSGGFTPPFTGLAKRQEPKPYLAMLVRIGRKSLRGGGAQVRLIEVADAVGDHTISGDADDIASAFATLVLCTKRAGTLIVTSDSGRHVMDVCLDSLGPCLLRLGYTIQPMLTAGNVSFIVLRKGRYKWTVATYEGVTGRPVSCGLEFAELVGCERLSSRPSARHIWNALTTYAEWLSETFGCALNPTVGMTAMSAARSTMGRDIRKWRPEPLRVAIEREGKGYRGGITYGRTYRGPSWRVDVNRQYTHALRQPLPLRSAFGRLPTTRGAVPWAGVCRVSLGGNIPYPLAIWNGPDLGFSVQYHASGEHVCILHSSELSALERAGGTVLPSYGYVATATFTFSDYVELLQAQIHRYGRSDPRAAFSKPLGNYVYGKFGQSSRRTELLYSDENPGKVWYPYWAPDGTAWESVWERETEHVGMAQHVDIAATITAYARTQTVSTWASLSSRGISIIRCHTDSLTVDTDPSDALTLSETAIGSWRLERQDDSTIVVGPNMFWDGDTAHIAGVTDPTYEMIDRLADGNVVAVAQHMKSPRHGFVRGDVVQERELRAGGG